MAEVGKPIDMDDVQMILDAVEQRKKNFPEEPSDMTMYLVLLNIGERFRQVTCTEGEWTGQKKDLKPIEKQVPMCPNGHPLFQAEETVKLGWVSA